MAGNRRKLQEGLRAQESRTLANFHKKIDSWEGGGVGVVVVGGDESRGWAVAENQLH